MERTWYDDYELFNKWLELSVNLPDRDESEHDELIYDFVRSDIPDDLLSSDCKEQIIKTLRKASQAGAPLAMLFGGYFRVVWEAAEIRGLGDYEAYLNFKKHYRYVNNTLLLDNPPHDFPDSKSDVNSDIRHEVEHALASLDAVMGKLFEHSDAHYKRLRETFRPHGTGTRKTNTYDFMGLAYHHLKEHTKLPKNQIYEIIADLLSGFTGNNIEPSNVKQQLHEGKFRKR